MTRVNLERRVTLIDAIQAHFPDEMLRPLSPPRIIRVQTRSVKVNVKKRIVIKVHTPYRRYDIVELSEPFSFLNSPDNGDKYVLPRSYLEHPGYSVFDERVFTHEVITPEGANLGWGTSAEDALQCVEEMVKFRRDRIVEIDYIKESKWPA